MQDAQYHQCCQTGQAHHIGAATVSVCTVDITYIYSDSPYAGQQGAHQEKDARLQTRTLGRCIGYQRQNSNDRTQIHWF